MKKNLVGIAEDAIDEAAEETFTDNAFRPLSTDPKEVWDEWYSKAWSKDKAREVFLNNPSMSDEEFTLLLGNLYKPGDLAGKAVAFRTGLKKIEPKDRVFFENWLLAESNDLLKIIESKMDS